MTQVDQVVSGLLTGLYLGGEAIPAAVGGRFAVLENGKARDQLVR